LGQPFAIKAQRHRTPVRPEAEQARPAWYKDVKLSGDLIVENAVHNLDVRNWAAQRNTSSRTTCTSITASSICIRARSKDWRTANGTWYSGKKAPSIWINKGRFYQHGSDEVRELITPAVRDAGENAMSEFYSSIREKRRPIADVTVAATAALTAILGREAIYRRRMVTWKELGVAV